MVTFNPVSSQLLVAINRSAATRTPIRARIVESAASRAVVIRAALIRRAPLQPAFIRPAFMRRGVIRPPFSAHFAMAVSAAFVVFVIVLTAGVSAPAQAVAPLPTLNTQLLGANIALVNDENTLAAELSVADSEIAFAQQVLAASSGKTLDEVARTKLAGQLAVATANQAAAESRLAAWKQLNTLAANPADNDTTAQLLALRQPVELSIDLTAVEDVSVAVAAWNAEQAELAAEAAQAAAAAAAAATPHSRHVSAAPASTGDSQDKASIAEAVFAQYGFSSYVFDGGQTQGHYGATDMNRQIIYLQLSIIPTSIVRSVALHEYQHILQAREYGGYAGAVANFGSVLAMEEAADCGALAAGATWVNYGCH
ncbi:MAG: hypothetical protein JWN80_1465 [Microbacteriaceae bacterium]|nr:hypothetical protein [Microbacteriaceae bacterium]